MASNNVDESAYEKHVNDVTENSIEGAIPIYQPLVERLSNLLRESDNYNSAQFSLENFTDEEFLKSFSTYLLDTLETSAELGASLIVQKDAALSGEQQVVGKDIGDDWFVCDGDGVKVSFNVLPKKALEYLRTHAIDVAGIESNQILLDIKNKIMTAIKRGDSFNDFKASVDTLFDYYGITKLDASHIQLVFRMNTFAAYSIGQAQKVSDMIDRFPLAYFSSIHDSKSRHSRLEGYYNAESVPLPPVDYNCRCGVRYIHISQITGNETVFEVPPAPELIIFDQRAGI